MDDEKSEAERLSSMADEAQQYIAEFHWAPSIKRCTLGFGVGGVIAVFLIEFVEPIAGSDDDRVWVFVGDLPSAYIAFDDPDNPRAATSRYCDVMSDWCAAVESNGDMEEVYPVEAPATLENAELLRSRIAFIRDDLLPRIPDVVR